MALRYDGKSPAVVARASQLAREVVMLRSGHRHLFDEGLYRRLLQASWFLRKACAQIPGPTPHLLAPLYKTLRLFDTLVYTAMREAYFLYALGTCLDGNADLMPPLDPSLDFTVMNTALGDDVYVLTLIRALATRWAIMGTAIKSELRVTLKRPARTTESSLLRHVLAPDRFLLPPRPPSAAIIPARSLRRRASPRPSASHLRELSAFSSGEDEASENSTSDGSGDETDDTSASCRSPSPVAKTPTLATFRPDNPSL